MQTSSMASQNLHTQTLTLLLLLSLSLISPLQSQSTTCTSQTFTNNRLYAHCTDLPSLNSFLHYTYDPTQSSLSLAFIAPPSQPSGWIAWAINPNATGMAGSQTLLAFREPNGEMTVRTFNISSYSQIVESRLSFEVRNTSAEYSGGVMRLFATVVLPEKDNRTVVNQVWQVGPSISNGMPGRHAFLPANLNARGTLDVLRGQSTVGVGGGGDDRLRNRNIHGILNAISWGILFPIGVIIARYMRTFESADPAWFYLHVLCQFSAYAIGVAGWGTGLKLGSESRGFQYTGHRNIGISLFCLATVQILALFLRPKKDHKYRYYWNIYHHTIGYSILVLGIINVFKGLDILDPSHKWRSAYIIVIASLGVIALLLEAITWIVVLRRKSHKSTKPYDGYNGQDRQQPLAT